jgi:hypothetical protein
MSAPSLWAWTAVDYRGGTLSAAAAYDDAPPYGLVTVTLSRTPGCQYASIYFGRGPDGAPDSTPRRFFVPAGSTMVGAGVLAGLGLVAVTDIWAGQITAGP